MTARPRPRRDRLAGPAHAPARPRESSRRIEQVPSGADIFAWRPGEVALGPIPRRRDATMTRITALYHRGEAEDA